MNSAPPYAPRLLPLRLPRVCVAVTGSDPQRNGRKSRTAWFGITPFWSSGWTIFRSLPWRFPGSSASLSRIPEPWSLRPAAGSPTEASSAARSPRSWIFWAKPQPQDASWSTSNFKLPASASPNSCRSCAPAAALILSFHDFRGDQEAGRNAGKDAGLPGRLLQSRQHRDHARRQRHHDQVPRPRRRPALPGRHVHGRTRNHQPRSGRARRERVHLCLRHCRAKKRPRAR